VEFFHTFHMLYIMFLDYYALILILLIYIVFFFFFQAEDGIRDFHVTGVQTCALPIFFPRLFQAPGSGLLRFFLTFAIFFGHDERSEERRVGKECRYLWKPYQYI